MGVRGLQGFVARVCPDACQTIDLREMAEKHRVDHPDCPPVIVVDAMSCVRRWYTPESWVCGGQWREYLAILEDFINAFMAAGIKLVFYFDGVVEEKKRDEWIKRRMKNTEEIARLFQFIKTHRKQPGREMFVLPSALPTFTRYALKSLGQKTVCTLQEADLEVAAYGLQHNCIGILGQDSDYLIYDTCPYFSIENLRLDRLRYSSPLIIFAASGLTPTGQSPSCARDIRAGPNTPAKEQHIQSENYSIFNILSHGEIECSNSLEDDYDTEIPGQALIYRPARQHIYYILLESGKGGTRPLVKEWFVYFGNPLKQPDLIQPVQPPVTGGTPNLKTLWLAKGPDVEKQRYSTFLACFHLQDEMEELQALEAPVAGFCCLLAYLMMQVSSLSLEDLNAFLALILCLKGKSAAQLTGLQVWTGIILAQVDSRAVHLGAVLIRGLTTLLMANSACGFPFRMDDLMPWAVFDGKLFQEKYQKAHQGCSVEELLEGNVENRDIHTGGDTTFLLGKEFMSTSGKWDGGIVATGIIFVYESLFL
ncbi:Constitutive coactivator of peroxisome proliferator-activated receptor gamma [Lonchura striata]|uniref:Constitutive coactivator of peroxisome proliferator-activated receptor gamma n=1 Tax=Lonchura striata TaxID=40157 RepID=A0A218VBF4_9PASE|nr:Constitutive coactivator of peroxisome proliferator-activated receptor gamma [Lonchura striata domestica]